MSRILCLETATEICSVGLSVNGELVALRENTEGNAHSRILTVLIDELMDEAGEKLQNIDAVALSAGPGSYTSLRVGASVAKGICFALDKPFIAVDTLKALAFGARHSGEFSEKTLFVPMIDARRMEVFTAIFDKNLEKIARTQPMILDGTNFYEYFEKNFEIIFCGNGAEKCRLVFKNSNAKILNLNCSAKLLSYISFLNFQNNEYQDIVYFEPNYVKNPNISIPKSNF
jgi:tRNA threonylcarbamoyladenosine biosynthesis protein TsaB